MSKTGGTGDAFRIREYKAYPEAPGETTLSLADAKKLLEDFSQGMRPLTDPIEPVSGTDPASARKKLLSTTDVDLSTPPQPVNAAKRSGLRASMEKLGTFAKNHPWLTAGLVFATLMVGVTAYLTVQAFLGHDTISILGAHPEIGGGLTFMMVYYTVYLINLCRRSALKDDLEARIHEHNKFIDELSQAKDVDLEALGKRMNAEIMKLGVTFLEIEQQQSATQEVLQQQFDKAKLAHENIKNLQQGLLRLYREQGTTMPEGTRVVVEQTMDQLSLAIRDGARMAALEFPSRASTPVIPTIEILPSTIVIPPLQTETMKANAEKLLSFREKIQSLLAGAGTTLKQSPGSMALFVGGLGMCVLSGVAIFFYLHGATNLYFFGSLSLMSIVPMGIYGISLIYEGYNNATIGSLQRDLEEIERNGAARKEALDNEQKRLERIQQSAAVTLQDFTSRWTEFQKIEAAHIKENTRVLAQENVAGLAVVQEKCETTLRLLYGNNPDIQRILQGVADGANLVAQ